MARNQFTFYESFYSAIRRIRKDTDRVKAYDAVCCYALTGEIPDLDALPDSAAIAFDLIRPNLDTSRRKSENGKQGGERAEANRKQAGSKPVANEKQAASKAEANGKQTPSKAEAKPKQGEAASEGEVEVEVEKEGEIEIENECYISPLPPSGEKEKQKDLFAEFANGDTKLLAALTAFDQMRTRIKKPMTDRAKELLLAKLQTFPSRDWTAILDQSVMSCWQGIFPLGGDKAQRTASEPKTFTELLQEAQHGY
jgi:hypothetical protein